MKRTQDTYRLAVFLATSGHSGVDRIMGNLLPSIAEHGIRVDLLSVRNHGPFLKTSHENLRIVDLGSSHALSSLPPLMRYLKRENPDILLSDKDRVNRVAIIAARLSKVDTKVFVRMGTTVSFNLDSRGWYDRLIQKTSMKHLYPLAEGVLTPSVGAADDMARYTGLDRTKIQPVPSPVVTGKLMKMAAEPPVHPWFEDKDIPVIVAIGELCPRKDFTTLIHAFGKVRRSIRARLLIMGKGRQRQTLEKTVSDMRLTEEIRFAGFVENPYSYLSRANLYVHSARWEGSPVALMEAAALGIPMVSTDCPSGPREILADGQYGKLVPVGDHEAMGDAIIQTLEEPPDPVFIRGAAEPYRLETATRSYMEALGIGPGLFTLDQVENSQIG